MRRSYISPEFDYNDIYGSYNMAEESNFFGAKMLEIEDTIYLDNTNVVYFQNNNGEQIDFASESILEPKIFSITDSKQKYHQLKLDESQSQYQKSNNTRWILDINLLGILSEFIFAEMKKWRTFEGIGNSMTFNNDVNSALKNYVSLNVTNRYKLSKLDLFIEYNDLRSNSLLMFKNIWSEEAYNSNNKFTKFETQTTFDGSSVRILFSQEKPSSIYNFKYYFNPEFVKI